jgi:hypothetical protein
MRGRGIWRYVWSAPYGVVGLFVAALFYALRWVDGRVRYPGAVVLVARGPLARAMLARGWGGVTIGWVVLFWEPPTQELIVHEVEGHVEQVLSLGVLFPLVYLLLLARYGYVAHPLEVEARAAAGRWRLTTVANDPPTQPLRPPHE